MFEFVCVGVLVVVGYCSKVDVVECVVCDICGEGVVVIMYCVDVIDLV